MLPASVTPGMCGARGSVNIDGVRKDAVQAGTERFWFPVSLPAATDSNRFLWSLLLEHPRLLCAHSVSQIDSFGSVGAIDEDAPLISLRERSAPLPISAAVITEYGISRPPARMEFARYVYTGDDSIPMAAAV